MSKQIENKEEYDQLTIESKARVTYNFLFELYGEDLKKYQDYRNGDSDDKPNNYNDMKVVSDILKKVKSIK